MSIEAVNLHEADGDPRKSLAIRRLMTRFPEAIAYWHGSGITERSSEGTKSEGVKKHKHGVLAHHLSSAIYSEVLANWLCEMGLLTTEQVSETALASLVHDADKPIDMAFISMAMGGKSGTDQISWEKAEEIICSTDLTNKSMIVAELATYAHYFNPEIEIGDRVHVARSIVAAMVHAERLSAAGFSERVIAIQAATEYSGCDQIDDLLDLYPHLEFEDQVLILQMCVVSYIDICMMESVLVDPHARATAVFQKPINASLNSAWSKWNKKGETAETKQIRVGLRIRDFLAKQVGINGDSFAAALESKVQSLLTLV